MLITPCYAAFLGLGFVILSILTLRLRRKFKIGLGDGGNQQLLRAIRVHSNFAEYVPIALILIYMTEINWRTCFVDSFSLYFVVVWTVFSRLGCKSSC